MNETTDFAEMWVSVTALRSAIAGGYVKPGGDERTTLVLAAEIDRLREALHEIAEADMTTKGFQMMAAEALDAPAPPHPGQQP